MSNSQIIQTSKIKISECSCDKCVSMCKTAPCLGTPEDIIKLTAFGYGDKIMPTTVSSPSALAFFHKPINVWALEFDKEKSQCCMLDDNGKCMLHAKGLKPLEGKLATCKPIALDNIEDHPMISILKLWKELDL